MTLLRYHLVFTTKYRRKAISARVLATILAAFRQACGANGWTLDEADGESDHVHLLLGLAPMDSLSDAVRVLKCNSSKAVRSAGFPEVRRKLWGSAFWSPSYFAVTCGGAPLEAVRRYIENQTTPTQ